MTTCEWCGTHLADPGEEPVRQWDQREAEGEEQHTMFRCMAELRRQWQSELWRQRPEAVGDGALRILAERGYGTECALCARAAMEAELTTNSEHHFHNDECREVDGSEQIKVSRSDLYMRLLKRDEEGFKRGLAYARARLVEEVREEGYVAGRAQTLLDVAEMVDRWAEEHDEEWDKSKRIHEAVRSRVVLVLDGLARAIREGRLTRQEKEQGSRQEKGQGSS